MPNNKLGFSAHVEKHIGTVVAGADLLGQGSYKVHIPNLMGPNIPKNDGILCKNRVHKTRMTYLPDGTSYGEYKPIHPGTGVMVEFYENNYTIGYIVEFISDQTTFTMPATNIANDPKLAKVPNEDRDNITTIFKTRNNCRLDIFEGASVKFNKSTRGEDGEITTTSVPTGDSLSLKYKDMHTYLDMNNDGMHIFTGATVLVHAGTVTILAGEVNITAGNINMKGNVNITGPLKVSETIKSDGDMTAPAFHGKADSAIEADDN
jgi:phage baseplate assembly protein gpV